MVEQDLLAQMKGPFCAAAIHIPGVGQAGNNAPFAVSPYQTVKDMAGYKGFRQQIHIQRVKGMQFLVNRKPQSINLLVAADFGMMPEISQQPALQRILKRGGAGMPPNALYGAANVFAADRLLHRLQGDILRIREERQLRAFAPAPAGGPGDPGQSGHFIDNMQGIAVGAAQGVRQLI
ncbi:hypothetical protein D3C75_876250 [compost metagenome]